MGTGKAGLQQSEEKHSECQGWGDSSKALCSEDNRDTTLGNITHLAKGRVKVPIPSKSLDAFFGALNRVKSNKMSMR